MAEENKTSNTAFEDMMLTLFGILLVGQMLQKGPELLSEHLGINLVPNQYLVSSAALHADTPLGTRVSAVSGAGWYESLSDTEGEASGMFLPGTSLELIEGPEMVNGERWWKVRDTETGKVGWVPESALIVEGIGGIGPATKLGTQARALLDTDVWNAPGGLEKTGTLVKGVWGELTKGPQSKQGSRWWFFDSTDDDNDGWVPEAALTLASETGWHEGSSVRGTRISDIFERAGGGKIVGLLAKGEKAKLLGGPIAVGGKMWWLLETEEDESGWVPEDALEDAGVKVFFKGIIAVLMIIGTIITLLFLGGIVYVTIRTNQIRAREAQRIKAAIPKKTEHHRNERWEKVLKQVSSENPSDWRFAILEADVMLEELFTRMGYTGETLGEKMKQAVSGDIKSLDAIWEAHKVRNMIAHEGGDYILTQREARRIIDLYRQMFEEFKYI